ncbi:glycine cleavage system aminomethyltransferase GcvT [Candidatus Legionella polyplacis]|uniref:aminomethyltransferase n=1 Tax=Candidatus Legionella polyplacis TaxID=2005262 RepID=A0ABZ2GXW5_9GAMM
MIKTILYDSHIAIGAKLVQFHNWIMPLHYGSIIQECLCVRENCGVFDISHMTIIDITGNQSTSFLRKLLTNDITLLFDNQSLYSCMCNDHGGIIDDLIVYKCNNNYYRLVFNASTRIKVLQWIFSVSKYFSVKIIERNDFGMLSVQGPDSITKIVNILNLKKDDVIENLDRFGFVIVDYLFISRTGYTGEDGLEIILLKKYIVDFWNILLENNIKPCGLGSRDVLRLEAGMLLSGVDINENVTPLESSLEWTIKWFSDDRDFIGMNSLLLQKKYGVPTKLIGLIISKKKIMRHGYKVLLSNNDTGVVTSGVYSPFLKKSIAFARIPWKNIDKMVQVLIYGEYCLAKVCKLKFVR